MSQRELPPFMIREAKQFDRAVRKLRTQLARNSILSEEDILVGLLTSVAAELVGLVGRDEAVKSLRYLADGYEAAGDDPGDIVLPSGGATH